MIKTNCICFVKRGLIKNVFVTISIPVQKNKINIGNWIENGKKLCLSSR